MISKSYKPVTTLEEINLERGLLNHIAKLMSNHCDHFVEDTLEELLSDYTENDKLLIRLDKIFTALNIRSEQEVRFLLNFFLPYAHCPTCIAKNVCTPSVCGEFVETTESSSSKSTLPDVCDVEFNEEENKLVAAVRYGVCCDQLPQVASKTSMSSDIAESSSPETPPENVQIESTCVSDGVIEVTDADGEPKRQLVCDQGHLLVIETEFVSNALKDFIERCEFVKNAEASFDNKKSLKEKVTVSRNITEEDITEFWERYRNIFSEDRERLWDNLIVGLKKYYEILKDRHQLNIETEALRKQNAELRRLLNKYASEITLDNE